MVTPNTRSHPQLHTKASHGSRAVSTQPVEKEHGGGGRLMATLALLTFLFYICGRVKRDILPKSLKHLEY